MASISDIPDELLLNILSSLPSKEVVATSVLSKRWRSLWTEVKTFRYDGESIGRTYWKFVLFISKRSSVETMQLKLNPHCTHRDIKPLINIAVARSLRELRIEMICESFELPKSFYMFSQLETVILEKVSLKDVPRNAHLPCLKRLHLLSVKFTGDESVKKLLSICPILEELVVKRSSLTNVMIYTIDAPLLRILSIDNTSGKSRPEGVHGFVINAPSLRCFSIRDSFSNYLQFENMPQLVKARVNVVCDEPDKFLGSLASTQYLSLCSVTSETPDSYLPIGTSFVFLDHLELCLCSTEWWNLLTCILVDAPKLRVLKLKLYRKHCVRYNEAMDQWNQPDYVPMCLSSYLEIFEWRQYNGKEKEREVAKYILANASRLKKATFYSESGEKHGILKELEYMARVLHALLQILNQVVSSSSPFVISIGTDMNYKHSSMAREVTTLLVLKNKEDGISQTLEAVEIKKTIKLSELNTKEDKRSLTSETEKIKKEIRNYILALKHREDHKSETCGEKYFKKEKTDLKPLNLKRRHVDLEDDTTKKPHEDVTDILSFGSLTKKTIKTEKKLENKKGDEMVKLFEAANKSVDVANTKGVLSGKREASRCVDALLLLMKINITPKPKEPRRMMDKLEGLTKHKDRKICHVASALLHFWRQRIREQECNKESVTKTFTNNSCKAN